MLYHIARQQIAGDDTGGGSDRPARKCDKKRTVTVVGIEISGTSDGNAEQLVRQVKCDKNRWIIGVSGENRWLMAQLIRR